MLQPLFSFAKKQKIKKLNKNKKTIKETLLSEAVGRGDNKLSLPDKVLPVN